MARGRMINNAICADKRVNELADDTSRLAFTWLITFADRNGRTHGDPVMLCSMIFPRRRDITPQTMETYVHQWADLGLITWYEASGDLWISFPAFDGNQPGLRKDREPDSGIPAPSDGVIIAGFVPETCRMNDGETPDDCPPKRKEEKQNEENDASEAICGSEPEDCRVSGVRYFENTCGMLNGGTQVEEIRSILEELHARGLDSWWKTAIDIAVDHNARNWAYVRGVLENHLKDGTAPARKTGPITGRAKPQKRRIRVRDETGEVTEREVMV